VSKSNLIGTYQLVSWEHRHESGEVTHPLGPDAQGVISYSQDGYVSVHIMAKNRKAHAAADLFGGEMTEFKNSATTHLSYCGTFEIQGNEVVHHVSICSFPNWVNSQQRRDWEFKNGQLLLTAHGVQVGNEKVGAYLVWQPVTS
jgi:hypothetical protein